MIQVMTLADSAVQIAVKPWAAVADYGAVAGELNLSLLEELRRRGIGIPYPQMEVRLIGGGDLMRDFALEVYFSKWEFAAKYNLTGSDGENMTLAQLLALAAA